MIDGFVLEAFEKFVQVIDKNEAVDELPGEVKEILERHEREGSVQKSADTV